MCSVIRLLHQSGVAMDAALELVRPGPPSCTLVLADEDGTRAGDAADRRIARVVQRVVGNLVHVDVRLDALRVPIHDGLDLPDAVALRPLDALCICASQRLLAADAGDPGVVRRERALERLDLADVTATVGVALPEVRALRDRLLRDGGDLGALEREPVAPHEAVAGLRGPPVEKPRGQRE